MAKPGLEQVFVTDTFQGWLNKTNEIVTLFNTEAMTASVLGDTTTGNATLDGTFTANLVNVVDTLTADTASVSSIQHKENLNSNIDVTSPLNVSSITENMLTLRSPAEYKPQFRLINGSNIRWMLSHDNSSTTSSFIIQTEGAVSPQVSVTQSGRIVAAEFQGDGLNITNLSADAVPNLDASKITTGILGVTRIPNLDASKIITGILGSDRIPNLDASKIATGVLGAARIPELDGSKITTGVLGAARIPELDGSKITTGTIADARLPATAVRTSRTITGSNGITVSGNGDLSADRAISPTIATLSDAQVGTATNVLMNPQRTLDAINANAARGYIVFNGSTGEVFKSRNLTLVKNGTGNYSISCASAIRNGTTNWGVVITNVDDGRTGLTPSITNGSMQLYNAFVSSRTANGFSVAARTFYNNYIHLGGNDNNTGNVFGITAVDPNYIAIIVF